MGEQEQIFTPTDFEPDKETIDKKQAREHLVKARQIREERAKATYRYINGLIDRGKKKREIVGTTYTVVSNKKIIEKMITEKQYRLAKEWRKKQ